MSEQFDRMLEKVQKLLAKAEDPACTSAEAEAFTEKATELISRYGFDAAMVAQKEPTSDKIISVVISAQAPYSIDKMMLAFRIAQAFRCQGLWVRDSSNYKKKNLKLIGFESDIRRAELLYTSLLVQATQGLIFAEVFRPMGENTKSYKTSWFQGFTLAVGTRLCEAERKAKGEAVATYGSSTDLVMIDREAAVKNAYEEMYPNMRKGSARAASRGSGRGEGYNAGQRADLGNGRLSGAHKAVSN